MSGEHFQDPDPSSEWDPAKAVEALAEERQVLDETPKVQSKRIIEEGAPTAAHALVYLAAHSENEKTRLDAAKYILERTHGRVKEQETDENDDPFERFLAGVITEVEEHANAATNTET